MLVRKTGAPSAKRIVDPTSANFLKPKLVTENKLLVVANPSGAPKEAPL